ncbi:hypothetical protein ACLOJK_015677 [Asimina triloba]
MERSHEKKELLLQHILVVKFKEEITPERIEEIVKQFASLQKVIKQIKAFYWGKDVSREHLQQGYTHVIEIHFENEDDVAEYIINPDHDYFDKHIFRPSLADYVVVDFYPIHMKKA